MSTKNIYLFKVTIKSKETEKERQISDIRYMIEEDLSRYGRHNSIKVSYDDSEPIMLDVLENTEQYLFARLSRKKANNKMQKRDYTSFETSDVLSPDEQSNSGVELFTYCILGYKHGILSIANSSSAPSENAFAMYFGKYHLDLEWTTESIMNNHLIDELTNGKSPEINRIQIDVAQPEAQLLQDIFGFNDDETIDAVSRGTSSIVFDIKPEFRGSLLEDKEKIRKIIANIMKYKKQYNSVVIAGKPDRGSKQRKYDLYEEYFKYPITIKEFRTQAGRQIEVDKEEILQQYKERMNEVYDQHKISILAVANR